MHVEEHHWHSPRLDRDMHLKVYGHWGAPLIVFPCSRGRYFDYEGMGMIAAVADFIDAGRVKLFCVDSVDAESWYDFAIRPPERRARQDAYDGYVVSEVIPFIRDHCRQPGVRVMTNGCSMGAYHAVNFFFRHPDVFAGCIALSGLYRLDRPEFAMTGADIAAVYYHSPLHYLAGAIDPWYRQWYCRSRIVVCTGQGAWEDEAVEDTRALSALLRNQKIPAWIDFWGTDVNHDWPWWYRQMNHFLGNVFQ